MDAFKARAKGLSDGLEPELSVVVDAVFPLGQLTDAVAAFQQNSRRRRSDCMSKRWCRFAAGVAALTPRSFRATAPTGP